MVGQALSRLERPADGDRPPVTVPTNDGAEFLARVALLHASVVLGARGMPHMKSLMVEGNPMKSIRRDIIQRGTVGLLKYLRMRIDDDELKRLREKGNVSPMASPISGSPPVPDKYAMKTAQMMNMSKKEIRILPDEAVSNAIEADVNGVDLR